MDRRTHTHIHTHIPLYYSMDYNELNDCAGDSARLSRPIIRRISVSGTVVRAVAVNWVGG